jgi:hydroxylamine reductase (hybrid-cluster protein)
VNEKEILVKGSIGEKHKNTEKLNFEDNITKTEENDTESEIDKTDFAKKTSHENKFFVKYSIEEKNKNKEKLNFGDNDKESEIQKTDFDKNTSLASDYYSPEKVLIFN